MFKKTLLKTISLSIKASRKAKPLAIIAVKAAIVGTTKATCATIKANRKVGYYLEDIRTSSIQTAKEAWNADLDS